MVHIDQDAPEFSEDAFVGNEIRKISLRDYQGKWVILFFYPGDFTFVCPTELGELADHYEQIKSMGAEIISVSTDSAWVHKAWHDASSTIKKITYPMLADPTHRVSQAYETYIEQTGEALRGTFIISPEGKVKVIEINNNDIGRSIEELIRKLEAAIHVAQHNGEVCPMNWKKGQKTLKPGLDLVGKI